MNKDEQVTEWWNRLPGLARFLLTFVVAVLVAIALAGAYLGWTQYAHSRQSTVTCIAPNGPCFDDDPSPATQNDIVRYSSMSGRPLNPGDAP